jgi:beta-glucanase (GH16 family)
VSIDPKNLAGTAVQTFAEEFDGPLDLWNGTQGRWCTTFATSDSLGNGGTLSGNGEQEWYINNRYAPTAAVKPWSVAGSILTITAAKADLAVVPLINGYQYTSGHLNTFHSFNQVYGYFEARMQLPKGQGLWPAFWLLPQSMAWPPEIDGMEVLGNDTTKLYTTVHSNSTGTHTSAGTGTTVPDMSAGFHLYGFDWEPDFIVFYFDRAEVFRTPTPSDLKDLPMYMILNLAVGGYWPGMADVTNTASRTPFPSQLQVDYVRAYRALGAAVAPPPAPPYVPPAPVPVPAPGGGGFIITGDDANSMQVLVGSPGNDIFYPGRRGSVMTGGGGRNQYVFRALPWAASHITDFRPGFDRLDLSPLTTTPELQTSLEDGVYSGLPGGTVVKFKDPSWTGGLFMIVELEKVPVGNVTVAQVLNPTPAVSAFGTSLAALDKRYASTPSAEKIAELKKYIVRLGG